MERITCGFQTQTIGVEKILGSDDLPVVAATDYIRMFADQIRAFVPARYAVLGTDGFVRVYVGICIVTLK